VTPTERFRLTQDLLITAFGLFLLVGGGDFMVRGSAALASRLGVSPLVIGLTVVAFGTSAPELSVNVVAALRGNSSMSFGNIFGSNMANIGLIVAVTAFFGPMKIRSIVVSREVPMMLLVTLVAATLGLDGVWGNEPSQFSRGDGIVLLLLFSVFGYYTLRDLIQQRSGAAVDLPGVPDEVHEMGHPAAVALTAAGLVALAVGGSVTVHGAEGVARAMGVSETIIGLTLVALGTSLPELVTSIIATMRGQPDIAIGNVVGSNIFNLVIVLGTTSVLRPVPVPEGGALDIVVVIGLSALLWLTSASGGQKIIRTEAVLLLTVYLTYMVTRTIILQ
jgi:cation:H+ antiporter